MEGVEVERYFCGTRGRVCKRVGWSVEKFWREGEERESKGEKKEERRVTYRVKATFPGEARMEEGRRS